MDAGRLESVPLFRDLSKREREQVARWADEIDIPAGKHLIDEGRFAHEFFALLDGTVKVSRGGRHLADLGPGDFFGEIALVETDRRTATVVTATAVRAVVMHRRDFAAMDEQFPEVARSIREAILERWTPT